MKKFYHITLYSSLLIFIFIMNRTSLDDAKKVIEKHFQIKNLTFQKKLEGNTHDSYIFSLNGEDIVVRLATKDNDKYYTEVWALKELNKAGVKGPDLLAYDDSKKTVPYRYTVLNLIDGEHPKWEKNTKSIIKAYLIMANQGLSQVHSLSFSGFGKVLSNGKGEFTNWSDFLCSRFNKANNYFRKNGGLEAERLIKVEEIHNLMHKNIILKKGNLVLGDLHPLNFFLKNGKFQSFIDFKSILIGDPLNDYAVIYNYIETEIWPNYIEKNKENQLKLYYYCILVIINKIALCCKNKEEATDKIKLLDNRINLFFNLYHN